MEASRFLFVLAVALVASQPTSAFEITDCTTGRDSDATLTSLSVSSCPDTSGERCIFTRGDNSTMTMEFLPTKVFEKANISIMAKLGFLPVPFHFQGPTDACGNYGFNCPTKVGEATHMKFSLPVQRSFPAIKAVVHFEMKDERALPIVCFEFPVQLK